DGTGGRVRGGERLRPRRVQRDVEGAHAAGERGVGRQHRLRIAAGEVDRAGVAGRHVAEGVFRGDGDGARHAGRGGCGEAGQRQLTGCSRADREAGDGTGGRVGGGDGLAPRRLQGDRESVHPLVGGGEGVIGRQHRL